MQRVISLADILVLVGGVIPPAPMVPASTRNSARLKRVQDHSSPVSMERWLVIRWLVFDCTTAVSEWHDVNFLRSELVSPRS